jgi:restriction endonuclease Mrr
MPLAVYGISFLFWTKGSFRQTMQSMVLWAIGNELEGAKFERLCVDLLYRNGYKDTLASTLLFSRDITFGKMP